MSVTENYKILSDESDNESENEILFFDTHDEVQEDEEYTETTEIINDYHNYTLNVKNGTNKNNDIESVKMIILKNTMLKIFEESRHNMITLFSNTEYNICAPDDLRKTMIRKALYIINSMNNRYNMLLCFDNLPDISI